ncbi:MAG TPA: TrbG/VirB9 family P-type conjugative transfer protein [Steroidobacteraceae bacterium]|jgi:type IV secretion system protein VirB9|nr:TrbG/VirB9 family P-type conjugative transfer protein [Steroidobacteraceae bacterium]
MIAIRLRNSRRVCGVVLLLCLLTGTARSESLPVKGRVDPRIRTAQYDPQQVYRLYGFVGYAIELIFQDGETFAGDAGGDLGGITFGWHTNHLILKPKVANVGTNLVVYTNRRAYRFEYSVSERKPDTKTDEVMFAVQFIYPPPPAVKNAGPSAAQEVQRALAAADESRPRNWNYWYCGSPSLKPVSAYDDGVHTWLTFGAKAELPAVFIRNDDGSESLLNFSIEQGAMVIHRVAARFILRRGKLTGCIVNKSFSGGGERLKSGTIAPDVERERKAGAP